MGNLRSLNFQTGKMNAAGIHTLAFAVRKSDIKTFPKLSNSPATAAEEVTYEGNIVMKDGKFAVQMYSTQTKGEVSYEVVGEKDCKCINNKATLKYPDLSVESKAFVTAASNDNLVVLVAHFVAGSREPQWVMLGDQYWDASMTPTGTSGLAPGDDRGTTIEIIAPGFVALPVYTGTITLEDGVYDCTTNEFTPNEP